MPGTGSATTSSVGLAGDAGSCTSSMSPALTRWLLPTLAALTLTPPPAARSAARVRESPNSRAMAESTRSPSSPSGTSTVRASLIGVLGMVHRAGEGGAAEGEHHDDAGADDDRDVGDVSDEQPEVVDEVDDVAATRTGLAEAAVEQVADGAAEQQAEGHRPRHVAHLARADDDPHQDAERDGREQPGRPVTDRERRPRVADQVEPDERPDEVDGLPRRERAQRPDLSGLVEHEDEGRETEQHNIQPPPAAGRDRGRRGRGGFGRGR